MPVVDVDPDELRELTGHDEKDDDALRRDLFDLGIEFEGWTEDDEMQLEFAPDRLDRLSVEGIARSLRYHYGDDRGVYVPPTNDAEWTIEVADQPPGRPYVTGAVVRGLELDDDALQSLIQVQEKLHATMGRDRAKGAIGVHDLTMLKGAPATADGGADTGKSIRYTAVDPEGDTFVPLDAEEEMSPGDVLTDHPIGPTYGDLVAEFDRYPAIYDDIGLFSFPPVINGRRTEVTTASRDLFIEMTGTEQWTVDRMLNIVLYALSARGGTIEAVDVVYDEDAPGDHAGDRLVRPDFEPKEKTVTHARTESLIGVDLEPETVVDCAERAGLDATRTTDVTIQLDESGEGEVETEDDVAYEVAIPPYRVDVLHPLDVIDDIGRAYGFNDLEPVYPDVSTVGKRHDRSRLEDAARDALVGLGFEDLLNFHMINATENFERLNLPLPAVDGGDEAGHGDAEDGGGDGLGGDPIAADDDTERLLGAGEPVTIREPYSEDYTMLRTWALPSLLMVLENNTHRRYPQDLAEIGLAAAVDERENTGVAEHRTIAAVLARSGVSYEDARARLQALVGAFGKSVETPATEHPTFLSGRAADVVVDGETVGVIGEVHPEVLVEHDLELPVAAFELRLDALA